jgi:COP9 signalosome complex subunit 7
MAERNAALEGFEVLARTSKGNDCVMVIKQVLKHPLIYVFGELLEQPNVKDLDKQPALKPYLDLLRLFAYGTFQDYRRASPALPVLSDFEATKLKQLTIVSLAAKSKTLQYSFLMTELEMSTVRGLEDLIIESVYQGLVKGQLDQNKKAFEVQSAIGRDIGPNDVSEMLQTLESWLQASSALGSRLETRAKFLAEAADKKRAEEDDLLKQKEDTIMSILDQQEQLAQAQEAGMLGSMMGGMEGMMGGIMPMRKRGKQQGRPMGGGGGPGFMGRR